MLWAIFLFIVFVPINFALGYLIAVRIGLAPPKVQDAVAEVRHLTNGVVEFVKPYWERLRDFTLQQCERMVSVAGTLRERALERSAPAIAILERVSALKERFLPGKKRLPSDIGAKDLVVESSLAEAVQNAEAASILDLLTDRIRFTANDPNAAAGGGKWGDAGGKGGTFMVKKRRLEQLRSGHHLIEMDARIRSLRSGPDTDELLKLFADFQEDGKQIETLLASMIREVKARAPYSGGKLNETVARLDAFHNDVSPALTKLLDEVGRLEASVRPAAPADETPPQPPSSPSSSPEDGGVSEIAKDTSGAAKKITPIAADTILETVQTLQPHFESLVLVRHRLRDIQSDVNTLYARLDTNFEDIRPEDLVNASLNINNRLGIESTTSNWWRSNLPATTAITFALCDICSTQHLNESQSLATVDRLCRALGRELKVAFPQAGTLVGLLRGNCLCLATQAVSLDEVRVRLQRWQMRMAATSVVSKLNDTVSEWPFALTISLVGVGAKVSESDVFRRAEEGLTAAKKAGGGTFFVTQATDPEPTAAPAVKRPVTTPPPILLDDLEKWEEIDAMTAKIEKAPDDTASLVHRATMALRVDRPDMAAADLDKAVEAEPDKIVHYLNRGLFRRFRQEYDAAIADFSKILELQEIHATALKHRAIAYSLQGDNDAATQDYNKVVELVGVTATA